MSEDSKPAQPSLREHLIPANFTDDDRAMSKKIILGVAVVASSLIVLMALPSFM